MVAPVNGMLPIHPGELLREDMEALGLSARALADAIAVPHNRVAAILRGERAVTADTALRLAAFFGTSAEVWDELAGGLRSQVCRIAAWKGDSCWLSSVGRREPVTGRGGFRRAA